MDRIRKTGAALVVLVGLVTVLAPSAASAHALLVSSSPAPSSVLPKSPERVDLTFSEDV